MNRIQPYISLLGSVILSAALLISVTHIHEVQVKIDTPISYSGLDVSADHNLCPVCAILFEPDLIDSTSAVELTANREIVPYFKQQFLRSPFYSFKFGRSPPSFS